jgi:hypothetical protein
MTALALIFACIAGLLHVLFFKLESLDWRKPKTWKTFGLASQADVRAMAIDHCAGYGKVVKFLSVQPNEGGYISFACRWVPYGANARPLRTLY